MRSQKGHSIIELCIAVILLILLGLLAANVFVIQLAKTYNDRVCRDSIMLAAKEALEGKDKPEVIQAAKGGMDSCGIGGFFIGHPSYTKYSDEITTDVRVLTIQTALKVRVPISFLVMENKMDRDGTINLYSTYEYRIMNPKKIGTKETSSDTE